MPQGKGTYGSKVGRPPKKKKPKMMGGGMAKKTMGYKKGGMAKAGASNPPNRKARS